MKYTKTVPYFKKGDKIDKAAKNLPKKQKEAVLKVSSAQKEQERKDKLSSVGANFKKPTAKVTAPADTRSAQIENTVGKKAAKTRGEAFQQARKRGDSEFLWKGKRYHTRTAEEEAERRANEAKTSAGNAGTDVPGQSFTPRTVSLGNGFRSNIGLNSKYISPLELSGNEITASRIPPNYVFPEITEAKEEAKEEAKTSKDKTSKDKTSAEDEQYFLPGITRPVTSRYGYITQGPAAESKKVKDSNSTTNTTNTSNTSNTTNTILPSEHHGLFGVLARIIAGRNRTYSSPSGEKVRGRRFSVNNPDSFLDLSAIAGEGPVLSSFDDNTTYRIIEGPENARDTTYHKGAMLYNRVIDINPDDVILNKFKILDEGDSERIRSKERANQRKQNNYNRNTFMQKKGGTINKYEKGTKIVGEKKPSWFSQLKEKYSNFITGTQTSSNARDQEDFNNLMNLQFRESQKQQWDAEIKSDIMKMMRGAAQQQRDSYDTRETFESKWMRPVETQPTPGTGYGIGRSSIQKNGGTIDKFQKGTQGSGITRADLPTTSKWNIFGFQPDAAKWFPTDRDLRPGQTEEVSRYMHRNKDITTLRRPRPYYTADQPSMYNSTRTINWDNNTPVDTTYTYGNKVIQPNTIDYERYKAAFAGGDRALLQNIGKHQQGGEVQQQPQMTEEDLITDFTVRYLSALGVAPEDIMDQEGNLNPTYVEEITNVFQQGDIDWESYMVSPDEYIQQFVGSRMQMARKGAKLKRLSQLRIYKK